MGRPKNLTYAGFLELISGILGLIPPVLVVLAVKFSTFEAIIDTLDVGLPWRGGVHFTIFLIPPFVLGWALLAQEPWAHSVTSVFSILDMIIDLLALDIIGTFINLGVLAYLNTEEVREVFASRKYSDLLHTIPKDLKRRINDTLSSIKLSFSTIKTPTRYQLISRHSITLFLLILLFIAPLVLTKQWITPLILFLTLSVLAASWDLLGGYTGQISFGHAAFFGIGAYTAALLNIKYGISPWAGFIVAGIFTAELGILIGLPGSRLRVPYLFITTLAFAEALRLIIQNAVSLTRGASGLQVQEDLVNFGSNLLGRKIAYFYLGLIIFLVLIGIMYVVANRTDIGLSFKAIQEDQTLAGSLGVDITGHKMLAFGISSFVAGLIGAFYAYSIKVLTPDLLGITWTANTISIAVIGGMGTILGSIVAAFLITILAELLKTIGLVIWNLIFQGLAVILVIVFIPGGLWSVISRYFNEKRSDVTQK